MKIIEVGTRFALALYRRVAPRPIRSAMRLQVALLRGAPVPEIVDAPKASRVIVLAPHMDDEVLGCGATAALSARRGARVSAVFLTDGSRGYDKSRLPPETRTERRARERNVAAIRKEESRRAGRCLGFEVPVFLDLPDGALRASERAVAGLADVLRRERPEVVFLPFLTDPHPDHWMTNVLFLAAASRVPLAPDLRCWGYEIWAPLLTNAVVDVTDVIEQKREAMGAFRSQNVDVDYPRVMLGLNAYRALLTRRGAGYAEAFFVATLDVYRGLYEAVSAGAERPVS